VTGRELRNIRIALGMSLDDLAVLCGVDRTTVWRWEERGVGKIPASELHHMMLVALETRVKSEDIVLLGKEVREALRLGDMLHAVAIIFSPWANPRLYGRNAFIIADWIKPLIVRQRGEKES